MKFLNQIDGADKLITDASNRLVSDTEKTKLDAIEVNATKNDSDINLKNRANHTGTQLSSTISNFASSVRSTALTGISIATNAIVNATDTMLTAIGKLQKQITDNLATLTSHTGNSSNPHNVTKAQIGLSNSENTSDFDKPISSATQTALDSKVGNSRVLTDVPLNAKFTDTTYSNATTSVNGLMSNTDKSKLDGVAVGATANIGTMTSITAGNGLNFTTITESGPVTLGTPSTVTNATTNSVTSTSHTHALTLTKADITALGIPASDTNTTYTAGSGIGLTGTAFSVVGGNGLSQETTGLALGTPSSLTNATTNALTATSHTHAVSGFALSSHGNHVPTVQAANDAVYLRNDNTWQTVSATDVSALPITGGTLTGTLQVHSIANASNGVYVPYPQGGSRKSSVATETGYIKITMPVSWTNTMLQFVLDIYDYSLNEAFTVYIGGYNAASAWSNCTAYIISNNKNRNFNVRFGHDGTKCAIYIGESTSAWSYPQMVIRNFYGGYQGDTVANWGDGWALGITTTLGTITQTITGALTMADSALSADKLVTARTINGVSFNGTANITIADSTKEPAFTKNTGFNKAFGTTVGTVAQGNDSRFTDARTPVAHNHTKANITDFAHSHVIGDLPTYPTSLPANGGTATTLTGLTSTVAELNFVDGVTSNIQTQLNGKVDDSQVLTNVPLGAKFTDTVYTHPTGTNPHGTTKTDVGLSLVDNVKQMPIAGGTATGIMTAYSNTSYTVSQIRNTILSTSDAVVGSMADGDIWIKYV